MNVAANFIQSLFGRRKTIQSIAGEDLRRERLGLDNEERRLKKDVDRVRDDDRRLLAEYAEARKSNNASQLKFIARKIEELRDQMKSFDHRHAFLSKQMRILNGIILLKENESFLKRVGSSALSMDLTELQMYVEEATSNGELTQERLDNLLQTMSDSTGQANASEDRSLEGFMRDLDAEVEHGGSMIEAAGPSAGELDSALASIDRELASTGRPASSSHREVR